MTRTLLLVLALIAVAGVGAAQPRPAAPPASAAAPNPAAGQTVACPALLVVAGSGSARWKSPEDTPRPLSQSEVRVDGSLTCTYPLDMNGAAATLSFPGQCRASSEPGWIHGQGDAALCKGADCHAICR